MQKIVLLTSLIGLCSISMANAMCTPTGVNIEKCECAHPIIENGHLACGPTYCPTGTTCMPLGNCCKTEKVCGSLSTECCKDDETCIDGISCCTDDKPYLDANGNCVECTTNEHCMQTTDSCGICSNGTCVASDAKCPQTMYCDENFACMCDVGYTTCSDSECCSSFQTCVNGTKCCSTNTPYLDANGNCVQCASDAHCGDGKSCDTTTGTCVEEKADIETLCANGGGTIISASSGTFCQSKDDYMSWYKAEEWCSSIGMTIPTMKEMCPSWDSNIGNGKCPELSGKGDGWVWSATLYPEYSEAAFYVHLSTGYVDNGLRTTTGYNTAFCH